MATTPNAGKEKATPTADEVEKRKERYSLDDKTKAPRLSVISTQEMTLENLCNLRPFRFASL
jgi:hypothetical protein